MRTPPASRVFIVFAACCSLLVAGRAVAQSWWDDAWPYRVPVTVPASGPVSVELDFGALFAQLGVDTALLDLRSVRVVSYDGDTPVASLPYAETYSVLLEDGESPQLDWSDTGVYWRVNDGSAEADKTRFSRGAGSVKATIENLAGGYGYPGVEMLIAAGDPRTDWSAYETLVYDVWPAVNESARDQAPDLYSFKVYNTTGCDSGNVTQGGPPLALDQWNPVSVSLKPLHTCTSPQLSDITRVELHTRDNDTVEGNSGLYDDGDVLTLWLDEVRLVDHNHGTIAFQADGHTTVYVYFDTLDHEGHPIPERLDAVASPTAGTPGAPQAGGYLHAVTGAATGGLEIWSAPSVEKVLRTHVAPTVSAPLMISAAKAEYEPFQLVVRAPTAQDVAVSISDFTGPAGTIPASEVELHRVDTVTLTRLSDHFGRLGAWPDPLYPIRMGATVSLPAGENQPLWFTVHVPRAASAGIYQATVSIGTATIPVSVRVWDFALPPQIHLAGGWNFGWSSLVERYQGTVGGSVQDCYWDLVDALYEHFAEHRLTPTGVAWPAGLNYPGGVEYDCAGNLQPDAWDVWGFGDLSSKYTLGGELADKDGFPAFQIKGPASNWPPDSRPDTFCDQSRGTDPPGNAAYNDKWFEYWTAVSDYLGQHPDLAARGYYHIVNEPQTFDDYNIVAYLAEQTKAAAPNVRILLSEQVEPFIHDNSTYPGAKIDVWMPTITTYEPEKSHERQLHYDEDVWWYFLYGDRPPLPNPTILDRPGIEARMIPWLAWAERVDGLLYYSLTDWSPDPWDEPWINDANGDGFMLYPPRDDTVAFDACDPQSNRLVTSLRWELLRDGMEDYELLWLANGGDPAIGVATATDALVDDLVASRTRFSRVPTDLFATRERLAGYITGESCVDSCAQAGTRCQGTALVVCEAGPGGCLEARTTDCAATAQGTCDEATTRCITQCANACTAGARCDGDELVRCAPDALGCLEESRTSCAAVEGGRCDAEATACVVDAPSGSDDCGCQVRRRSAPLGIGLVWLLLVAWRTRRFPWPRAGG